MSFYVFITTQQHWHYDDMRAWDNVEEAEAQSNQDIGNGTQWNESNVCRVIETLYQDVSCCVKK